MIPGAIGQAFAANLFDTHSRGATESATRLRAELIRFVRGVNRTWTAERDTTKLQSFFHPTVTAAAGRTQRDETRIGARLAVAQAARIVSWKESDFRVRVYGGGCFAIVSYAYDLTLDVHGQMVERAGRDLLALIRENNRWQIVADECDSYADAVPPRHATRSESEGPVHSGLTARGGRTALRWAECDSPLV